MEKKVENAMISYDPKSKTTIDHIPQPQPILKKRSSKLSKNFFKVVVFMMRGHSRKTKSIMPIDNVSKGMWKKLLGFMRPMHLQSNQSPPQILNGDNNHKKVVIENNVNSTIDNQGEDGFHNASEFLNSPSPTRSGLASVASSRYASAVGLSEMVEEEKEEEIVEKDNNNNNNENDDDMIDADAAGLNEMVEEEKKEEIADKDSNNNEIDEDDMIDAKAEDFIAKFYREMRLQRMDVRYNEMSMRSLGL